MRPDTECAAGTDQPEEYGGGGPFEYIEVVGLTTTVAAIVGAEVYGRSVLILSILSRLIKDNMLLKRHCQFLYR